MLMDSSPSVHPPMTILANIISIDVSQPITDMNRNPITEMQGLTPEHVEILGKLILSLNVYLPPRRHREAYKICCKCTLSANYIIVLYFNFSIYDLPPRSISASMNWKTAALSLPWLQMRKLATTLRSGLDRAALFVMIIIGVL